MYKRLKVKLYLNKQQKEVLDNHFNAYRFCYNLCLEYKSLLWEDYKISVSGYEMQTELLALRNQTEWLLKCKAECIRDAAMQVEKSFKNFFNGSGYPKFKSKNNEQSFTAYQGLRCVGNRIKFFGNYFKAKTSIEYFNLLQKNKIKQITFKVDSCGDYWASCLIEFSIDNKIIYSDKSIGIDLGLKDLIITSEGEKFDNKRFFLLSQKKLRKAQRVLCKKTLKSINRDKARKKVSIITRKIKRQREHYYHHISNKIISDNQTIVMETLRVKNMVKNRKLSKSISDASWGILTSMIEYKCIWNNRTLVKINSFYPSSKTCSCCGNIKTDLKLSDRMYRCIKCNLIIDRDLNAAINIKQIGIKTPELKLAE